MNLMQKRQKTILLYGSKIGLKKIENCVAVIGISGGKDSSIVAAFYTEALGKDRVYGVLIS